MLINFSFLREYSLFFIALALSLMPVDLLHADPSTSVDIATTEDLQEETIKVTSSIKKINSQKTSSSSSRDKNFQRNFPVSATNPQQLNGLLASTPGFVQNSANQVHARGEHSATSIYLQGFQLGGASQGRFGPLIDPAALENLEIMTGGFAPEYAGDSAVLSTTVKSGEAKPFYNLELGTGNYNTTGMNFSFGGQAGAKQGEKNKDSFEKKVFSYFLNLSARETDNALEAPQPHNQTQHNHGEAQSILGRFDLAPNVEDNFSLILNYSPAKTDIANRTGLPEKYAEVGQGYGFGGALSRLAAAEQGIVSQEKARQDIYQKDENNFNILNWKHSFNERLSSLLSIGFDQTKLDTLNNNPSVDLDNLPEDNSIEYNPTVKRDAKHKQIAGNLNYTAGSHSFKIGAQYFDSLANDSYELTPASQLAVDALYAADSRLVSDGALVLDDTGNPVTDSQGNQIYKLAPLAKSPTLRVQSRGYKTAGYLQDSWKMFDTFTANYGVRYDKFYQRQNLIENSRSESSKNRINQDLFSPRVNLSWSFYPSWIGRTSYNKLFIAPPLSQGSIIGEPIKPETVNQYEASVEKELTPRQSAKVAYYFKDIKNQVDTGLLIPSTQLGLFTSVNLDRARVRGLEFSYELANDHGFGTSAYTSYAYSIAKPSGFDNTGEPVEKYNDHDQRHTLSAGTAYTFTNRYSVGLNYYYGSGLASSVISEGGSRNSNEHLDLVLSSKPNLLFNKGGLKLTAANIFDERKVINFNSAFSGTRFQQGRTVYLSTFFNF